MTGAMAPGVRQIHESIRYASEHENYFSLGVGHMTLGELYLQMTLATEHLPFRVVLKNLGFLLRTVPVATRKARSHLEKALATFRALDSPSYAARTLMDLGLLDQAKNRPDDARSKLDDARAIAESVEATVLVEEIDSALANLS